MKVLSAEAFARKSVALEMMSLDGVMKSPGMWTFPCSNGNLAGMEQCLYKMAAIFGRLVASSP